MNFGLGCRIVMFIIFVTDPYLFLDIDRLRRTADLGSVDWRFDAAKRVDDFR